MSYYMLTYPAFYVSGANRMHVAEKMHHTAYIYDKKKKKGLWYFSNPKSFTRISLEI